VLSFGRGKGNTAGRGGALLARDARAAALVDAVKQDVLPPRCGFGEYVQLKMQWLFGRPWLYGIPSALPFLRLGETVYHPPSPVRAMSAVAARTLGVTWPIGERETVVRRGHAARLLARGGDGLTPIRVPAAGEAGYLRLPFVASPAARGAAGEAWARVLGIMPGYPQALCDLKGFADRVENPGDAFAGARALAARLVSVPTHCLLTEPELGRIEIGIARSGAMHT
jgi:perosamine synthetase